MTSAASLKDRLALCSPSAAITLALASRAASASAAIGAVGARLANWEGIALAVGVVDCLATRHCWGSANRSLLAVWALGLIGGILPACWSYGGAIVDGPYERGFRDSGSSSSDTGTEEEAVAGSSYRNTSH